MTALVLLAALAGLPVDPLLPGAPAALQGHTDGVMAVAFSPSGRLLASASRDKTVKLWSLETGAVLHSLGGAQTLTTCLAFSADGARLAVGDAGLLVRVVEVSTGKVLASLAHPDAVSSVAWSPDGALLAVGGAGNVGAIYSVASGKQQRELSARSLAFAPDGKTLIVASAAGGLSWLDVGTGKVRARVDTSPQLPWLAMTPSGGLLATYSGADLDVRLWSSAGKSLGVLAGPRPEVDALRSARVMGVALTPDGARVAVAHADGLVRLWRVSTRTVEKAWPAERNAAVALSPDGAWVAVADGALVKLWPVPPTVR